MLIDQIRKRMKVIIWFIVITFVISLFFVGASGYMDNADQSSRRQKAQQAQDLVAPEFTSQKPMAAIKMNNTTSVVTEGAFRRRVVESGLAEKLRTYPDGFRRMAEGQILTQMVNENLLYMEGLAQSVDVSASLSSQIDSVKKSGGPEGFVKFLRGNGFKSEEDFRDHWKPRLIAQEVAQKLFPNLDIKDDEVEVYYKLNKDKFKNAAGEIKPVAEVKSQIREILRSQVNEAEIAKYYEKHKERFRQPAKIDMSYLVIRENSPKALSAAESKVTSEAVLKYYKENAREFLSSPRAEVAALFLSRESLKKSVKTSASVIEAYYDRNKENYKQEEEVRASHILILTGDKKKEDQALKEIEKIKVDILTQVISFEDAAKKYSEDTESAKVGGDLGFFPRGMMVPEFEGYAFTGPLNKVSEPVKTKYGYHIILARERKEAGIKPLESIRAEVEKNYVDDQIASLADEKIKTIEAELQAKKASFEQMVALHSEAPSKDKQGVVGVLYLGDENKAETIAELSTEGKTIDYPVLNMLKKLGVGVVSDMVETAKGFYLFKINQKLEPEVKPLAMVEADVRKKLLSKAQKELFQSRLASVTSSLGTSKSWEAIVKENSDSAYMPVLSLVLDENLPFPDVFSQEIKEDLASGGQLSLALIDKIRYLGINQISRPIEEDGKVLFARMEKRHPYVYKALPEVQEEIRSAMTLAVTSAEVQTYFEENKAEYSTKGKFVIQQIMYKTKEIALSQMTAIQQGLKFEDAGKSDLNMDRASFAKDDGRQELTNLSFFDPQSQEKIKSLSSSQMLTEPIQSNLGYHLVKLVERTEAKEANLADSFDKIAEQLRREKQQAVLSAYVTELRNRAENVEIFQ